MSNPEIVELIVALIVGACVGISVYLGFAIPFQQPKNIKLQITFGLLATFISGLYLIIVS